jgi:multiple antibiotic resistance protein
MVAGPTSMTMVMLMPTEHSGYWIWLLAILIAWGITSAVLLASSFLHKVLKDRGLIAVERLMGMILVVMAVQMMLDGIREFFHI